MDRRFNYNIVRLGKTDMIKYPVLQGSKSHQFRSLKRLIEERDYYTIIPDYDQSLLVDNEIAKGYYKRDEYEYAFGLRKRPLPKIKKPKPLPTKRIHPRLVKEQVIEIKFLLPKFTNLQIAKKFGVTNECINCIRRGKSWGHIKI